MIIFVLFAYSCTSDSFMLRNHILITSKYYKTFFDNISIVVYYLNLAFEQGVEPFQITVRVQVKLLLKIF